MKFRVPARQGGFTLIELMAAVTVLIIVGSISFPAFNGTMRKVRTTAVLEDSSTTLLRARQESARRGVEVVVEPNTADGSLLAFANVDNDAALAYSPDATKTNRTVDYEVARYNMPSLAKMIYQGPTTKGNGNGGGNKDGGSGNTLGTIDGFTTNGAGKKVIVFRPDGSVRDPGALRVADASGNFFELRVGPAATGKISVLKYNAAPSWGDPEGFFPRGTDASTGDPYWVWSRRVVQPSPDGPGQGN